MLFKMRARLGVQQAHCLHDLLVLDWLPHSVGNHTCHFNPDITPSQKGNSMTLLSLAFLAYSIALLS